jgi:glycosyltransferase involved in cell wall biosynthesis
MTQILISIPAYNESKCIVNIIHDVKKILPEALVLVVDDCSIDNTRKLALQAGAVVLSHPINLGYASSLQTSYIYAVKNGFDIVVQMDGDGQHLAVEIPKILKPVLDGLGDIAIGSRYLVGSISYKVPWARRLGHQYFGILYHLLTQQRIKDPTSGFQCLNRAAFQLYTTNQFPDDFPDTDVLLMAFYSGLRIVEIPVTMLERVDGSSMHAGVLRPIYYIMKMTLSMFLVCLNYWKRRIK